VNSVVVIHYNKLSSYMADRQLGATHLVDYQLMYDSSSQNNCLVDASNVVVKLVFEIVTKS
jgi:hypothetical protein